MDVELVQRLVRGALDQVADGYIGTPCLVTYVSTCGSVLVLRVSSVDAAPEVVTAHGLTWTWPIAALFLCTSSGEMKALHLESTPMPTAATATA